MKEYKVIYVQEYNSAYNGQYKNELWVDNVIASSEKVAYNKAKKLLRQKNYYIGLKDLKNEGTCKCSLRLMEVK